MFIDGNELYFPNLIVSENFKLILIKLNSDITINQVMLIRIYNVYILDHESTNNFINLDLIVDDLH